MTMVVAVLMIAVVAGVVALPLLRPADQEPASSPTSGGTELWRREKAVALTAIREAEFDQATGKLSDEDYATLRGDYEERALHAMHELDRLGAAAPAAPVSTDSAAARFCTSCGHGFSGDERFCPGCGTPRGAITAGDS